MINILNLVDTIEYYLTIPSTLLFLLVGVILTYKTGFIQIKALPKLFSLLMKKRKKQNVLSGKNTISSFQALSTALATTLGMGIIVGPSIAIITGGPGALFWLVLYAFFGGVTKFTEVSFAMFTRTKAKDGTILGGPMNYLKLVHPYIANWYGFAMLFLFAGWSSLQTNTLAGFFALEGVPPWIVGIGLGSFILVVLNGGAKRVGYITSKMVPLMCVLYHHHW